MTVIVCHSTSLDSSFWFALFQHDQQLAERVQALGCPHCGGVLHVANYARKPRGEQRNVLGSQYQRRLSFCCAACRRRTTPPSVRFLGRKVYLGATIILLSSGAQGLNVTQRKALIDVLNLAPQTLNRWRHWWQEHVPTTRCWRTLSGWFSPVIDPGGLPGQLLARLQGVNLVMQLSQLLQLISPLTTASCPHCMRFVMDTQKM